MHISGIIYKKNATPNLAPKNPMAQKSWSKEKGCTKYLVSSGCSMITTHRVWLTNEGTLLKTLPCGKKMFLNKGKKSTLTSNEYALGYPPWV